MLISLIICTLFFSLSAVSAELSIIEKRDQGSVIISELDNPASFEIVISNTGAAEDVEIYTLTGIGMTPRGTFEVPSGTSVFQVQAFIPAVTRRVTGSYVFEYQIKGERSGIVRDTMNVNIVNLKDTLSIEPVSFKPNVENVRLVIKNRQNTNLNDVHLRLTSEFFTSEHTITLKPKESVVLNVPVDSAKTNSLTAGKYVVKGEVGLQNAEATIEGIIDYLEEKEITIVTETSGFLVRQKTLTRTNEGNVPITDSVDGTRDVLTRLFTAYSREPVNSERHALYVDYLWQKELQPSESWTLTTTTNYTFPFILLLLVIACGFLAHRYSRTQVIAHKQVTHVRTKSGQFAVKVQISVRARADVKNVQIIDRLPGMMRLYEKFGSKPSKLDATTRRMFWEISHLRTGEQRVISYIIYTTMAVVGRLELPPALVVFEHNGTLHEVPSNRAFFLAETVRVAE